ncbi:MAG: aminotransferase class I/II-fold pyridoxal phosphate-dependent enzyme [Candidatus Thiodiazotropha sp. (ex Ctena orbiculata)]|nr:aminotransferase class I/II-fold pyridoxal phosphate-dependent enzyme [Candidatus Thiodiazotropha taylori]MBT2996548.1 aminotransferase class I/II-fold pyridoxal phosphate-dependent enzyme [Candidatus Thiodiazotropha taylori]MBT3000588.1 aminotransferase class I/II-fold pyridoxal phosphate-dependent enzyme [Candidatus Thiodiazotropha taylori]MBV2106917.1 aminotransferase class I/II-fold pyridoxal phosphate-dependent enzyme [Candidatus Thiodiazotropha taylori]MBV2111145.1 aminotransferase cla
MKQINSSRDLAVNGAEPAFSEPLHVGRPTVGDRELFLHYTEEILDRQWLTNNGPLVQELEQRIAEYHNVSHCVAMCSGTVSLEIAIRALQLQGEVIIPSYTFVATAHALHWQAIMPVFADIDPQTHNLDPDAVRRMITPRTSGIIGVHLWGRPAPVEALQQIADEHNLELMFDAAHAFGSTHDGIKIGNFGRCEVLSFHATKFFHTLEGGAVLTNDDELAEAIRLMRNFGFCGLDNVIHPGTNGKMNEISAAMGLANLQSIENVIEHNRRVYHAYRNALDGITSVRLLEYDENEKNNYQYIVLEVEDDSVVKRDEMVAALQAENILARRYFWPGCHRIKPYLDLYPDAGRFLVNSEKVSNRVMVMPTGPAMDERKVDAVISVIRTLTAGR